MKESYLRKPVACGSFYPATKAAILKQLRSFDIAETPKKKVIACLLPHAGYIYSGKVAASTLACIDIPERLILLGPNHTGQGKPFSIFSKGSWQTPMGEVQIDEELAQQLIKGSQYLEGDTLAHLDEHSLEVELPLLQFYKKDFKIVPIALLSQDLSTLKSIGEEIAGVIKTSGLSGSTIIIASSDMTHYQPQLIAEEKDKLAIEAILELNEDVLFKALVKHNISMCGYAPAAVMLSAAKMLGAKKGELVKYQTSGDTTKDTESVVGYAGITIY